MITVYLDTSAMLKLYKTEVGSTELVTWLRKQETPILLSPLHELEFTNAIELNVHWKNLSRTDADLIHGYFKSDVDSGVYRRLSFEPAQVFVAATRLSAAHSANLGSRSLDILHVAIAKLSGAAIFVSGDSKQISLAKKTGMKTFFVGEKTKKN